MRKAAFACAGLFLLGAVAHADFMFYGSADRDAFAANTTINFTETFSSVSLKDTSLSAFTSQGIIYRPYTTGGNVWVTGRAYTNFGVPLVPAGANVLTENYNEDFTVSIPTGLSFTAVGFDTYLNSYGPVTIEVHTHQGWTTTTLPNDNYTAIGFFGVTSTIPITYIRWTAVDGQIQNTGIDNVQFGSVVPLPGALLLGLLGLGAAGLKLRKYA